jgi:hypothetical protein
MSEFEYLAVFVSIIFGISLTHILAGVIRSIYRGQSNETHLVLTGFLFLVMIVNWWTAFSWRSEDEWSFDLFLLIIVWSVTHYVAAITLYPPQVARIDHPFEYRRNWFLWAFVGIASMDILQTAARGDVFSPWYFLPFVLHYIALALLVIFVNRPNLHRWIAWYFLVSIAVWSLVVRRFLN